MTPSVAAPGDTNPSDATVNHTTRIDAFGKLWRGDQLSGVAVRDQFPRHRR